MNPFDEIAVEEVVKIVHFYSKQADDISFQEINLRFKCLPDFMVFCSDVTTAKHRFRFIDA